MDKKEFGWILMGMGIISIIGFGIWFKLMFI
jgi:hypothetical protein